MKLVALLADSHTCAWRQAAGDLARCRPADSKAAEGRSDEPDMADCDRGSYAGSRRARGPRMHAQAGLMKALRPREPVHASSRKDPHWGRRKLARDR